MVEITEDSPVKKLKDNGRFDDMDFDMPCHCGESHRVIMKKNRAFDKMLKVKGMLQLTSNVTVTRTDTVVYALDLAIEELERKILYDLNKKRG